jgi:diguanylate cyclase (GGDEF)-like protein
LSSSSPRVLVADPSVPVSQALRRYLEGAGFEVQVVHYLDEAVEKVRGGGPELLFCAATGAFDGETLCLRVKELAPSVPVVLVYPPEEDDPEPHAARAKADGYLVGPLKRGTVVFCARSMLRIRELQAAVDRLEADLKRRVAEPPVDPHRTTSGSSADFEFFKRLLLMEVKRSRRHRYPVSFLLVALDRFAERVGPLSAAARKAVLAEALGAVTGAVRDIDLAIPFSEERFLVFLPHTGREGALTVAERMRGAMGRLSSLPEATASIGVAAYEPGNDKRQVSFGTLMKDATEALRKAQLGGGDRVEAGAKVRRDRISMG